MDPQVNRYEPPRSHVAEPPPAQEAPDATRWRRFCTAVVDYLGFLLLSFLFGMMVGYFFRKPGVEFLRTWRYLYSIALYLGYYIAFESLWGRTPGKLVCGTVVVDQSGARAAPWQVIKRTLARCIPLEALTFFGKRGLHDFLSDTRVIRVRGR